MRKTVVTTVLTPAKTRDLVAMATVISDWGLSGDVVPFAARSVSRCSAAIEQYCNRPFAVEKLRDDIALSREAYPAMMVRDLETLQLSRWPVAKVESVTMDGATLTEGADFKVNADNGWLIRLDSSGLTQAWTGDNVSVVYYAGYALPGMASTDYPAGTPPLPLDVEDAASRMVYTRCAQRKRDPLVKSKTVEGIGSTTYLTPGSDGNMTGDITDILDNYRVPKIA